MKVTKTTTLEEMRRIAKSSPPDPQNLARSIYQSLRVEGVQITYETVCKVIERCMRERER